MADFLLAWPFTRRWEGGWSNVPGDPGGQTYMGLSRVYDPEWEGWPWIDNYVLQLGRPLNNEEIIASPVLEAMVVDFYRKKYWNGICGDDIVPQLIATFLFDWYVNSGGPAVGHLQIMLGVTEDEVMGPITVEALNKSDYPTIYNKLILARITFYDAVAVKHPREQKFLNGWLNRVSAFPQTYYSTNP